MGAVRYFLVAACVVAVVNGFGFDAEALANVAQIMKRAMSENANEQKRSGYEGFMDLANRLMKRSMHSAEEDKRSEFEGFSELANRIMKRGFAQSAMSMDKREQTKPCCFPPSFSVSTPIVVQQNSPYGGGEMEFNLDISYSAAEGKLYESLSMFGFPVGSALSSIDSSGRVEISVAGEGQCQYEKVLQFRDSYLSKYVTPRICVPEPMANFVGTQQWNGTTVDVYNLYSVEGTYFDGPQSVSASLSLKMRALRQSDGSCFPVNVELEAVQDGMPLGGSASMQPLPTLNPVDRSKFQSAC